MAAGLWHGDRLRSRCAASVLDIVVFIRVIILILELVQSVAHNKQLCVIYTRTCAHTHTSIYICLAFHNVRGIIASSTSLRRCSSVSAHNLHLNKRRTNTHNIINVRARERRSRGYIVGVYLFSDLRMRRLRSRRHPKTER